MVANRKGIWQSRREAKQQNREPVPANCIGSHESLRAWKFAAKICLGALQHAIVLSVLISPSAPDSTELDSSIAALMDAYHIPGVAACAVKNGQVIWTGAYGYANLEEEIVMANTTVFYLGSISKTVTGIALMQLCEKGLVGLDDHINNYLPFEVTNPPYPDFAITPRMLLTHTSSIRDNWDVLSPLVVRDGDSPMPIGRFLANYLVPGGTYYSRDNFNSWIPGEKRDYSNVAIGLAGYLVEAIAGIPFERYCRDSIFLPLGMRETAWRLADLGIDNAAMGYHWDGSTYVPTAHHRGKPWYPAGPCRSNTPQLARYLIAFMQRGQIGGVRILDSTTVRLMTTLQSPEIAHGQGLIWCRWHVGRRRLWGHTGSSKGFRTSLSYCPAENSGVVVLTNGESKRGVTVLMQELYRFAAAYSPTFVRADANADGTITLEDVLLTLKYIYVPGSPTPSSMNAADADHNGEINMSDAISTLMYLYEVSDLEK